MNTKIFYKDASKNYNEVIINGEMGKEQANEIFSCLQDGEYFIPGRVGLPESCSEDKDNQVWSELISLENTKDAPNIDMSVSEILVRFREAKGNWNDGSVLIEPDANELMVSGWVYYKTKATTIEEALSEFYKACEKAGINADNMQKAELRDPNGNEMPAF